MYRLYAKDSATDVKGNFQIDLNNQLTPGNYGWKPVPGSNAMISPNYYGNKPEPFYLPPQVVKK